MVSIMYNLFVAEKAKETTLFQSTSISKKDCCKSKACINVEYMSSEQGNTDQGDNKSEKRALQEASSMEESTT